MKATQAFKLSALSLAVLSTLAPSTVMAQQQNQQADEGFEQIQVTATRRSGTVQEAPLNISALDGDVLKAQNISELSDIARWVPGLTIADQGGRNGSPIIVRGLNTNSSGPDSDGGTVATYVGEIPLTVDLQLVDVERVEVLIGPQGTLYGAGTLGGAIRYIPKKVELDVTTGEVYGDVFSLSESDSLGGEGGFIFNTPIVEDVLGFRASINYLQDPGFIDYNYIVREGGTSLPDPDWSNSTAVGQNLRKEKDANGEETVTARVALRWTPTDWLDGTLTYYYQKKETEGRSIVHYQSLAQNNPLRPLVGKYESAYRYEEPYDNEDELLSLEVKADLGFAELVSATGWSKTQGDGQRDQTDLLIRLAYSYEEFPAFSSFTREIDELDSFTQEIRLVSQTDSPLSWIVGGYYNKTEDFGRSEEYTPNYPQFIGVNRPDGLEYLSVGDTEQKESALFGELTYAFNDQLDMTLGARFYKYDVYSTSAVALGLVNPDFDQGNPGQIPASEFKPISADDDGNLFKFNLSYKFSSDVMAYFTASEGFRIGGANGVAACPVPLPSNQIVCALPSEQLFEPDTTTNYELGFKSTWFRNKFHFNAALFNVDWDGAQVAGATVNGQQPITTNADGANSRGVEIATRALLSDEVSIFATYAYAKAELTANAPFLFTPKAEAGSAIQDFYDGKDGDRLPGSPEQQFSFGLNYSTDVLGDYLLDVNYGLTYQSDLITKVGLRADGETLPGYALSNLSAALSGDDWTITLYAENLFNKYAFSSTRRDVGDIGQAKFPQFNANRSDLLRNYGHYLIKPRTIGLRFNYTFDI